MAHIYPFKGYRFQKEHVGRLDAVVTQPYDKIPDELKADYLKRSPFNIVRVIRNDNYREAASFLEQWIKSGALAQDSEPCIYIYEQRFRFEGEDRTRIGLIGMVALDDPELAVKGHENVLARPLADRLNLIRNSEANEGLVFTLFSDPKLTVDRLLESVAAEEAPAIEVEDDFGVLNRIWAVSDQGLVSAVHQALVDCPLYIADGHHRYQTSLTFYRECIEKGWEAAASESFDKRMVALFNMDSEGMRILPTHRGVKGLAQFDPAVFSARLASRFEVTPAEDPDQLVGQINDGRHCFGFCWAQDGQVKAVLATLRSGALAEKAFMASVAGPLRSLDVSILHSGVFEEVLGITPEQVAGGGRVAYFREREDLYDALESGEIQLGCLLKPTSLEQVKEVSEFGVKMPQKSTDFYPKLLTGLVLMKMSISREGKG
jgi:uncharacterized protein (DUF1015 family)